MTMAGYTPEIAGTDVEGATVDTVAMSADLIASWSGFLPMAILAILVVSVGIGIVFRLARFSFG